MNKISRIDAFKEVVKTMKTNPELANQMLGVIIESLSEDKKNNTNSEYIEIKTKKEENMFSNILIKDSSGDCL